MKFLSNYFIIQYSISLFRKLYILVLKSFIGPFIATFFITIFVLVMQFLWLYIDDLIGKGLQLFIIAKLLGLAAVSMIPMALPIAVLLASIMTFGNLGEHFELTAIKASGISLQRIMFPLIIFSTLISIGAFFFTEKVIPVSNLKMLTLLYDVRQQNPALDIKTNVFNNDITDISIKIGEKSTKYNMMYDFMIYDHRDNKGNTSVIVADSGNIQLTNDMRYMIITLYDGISYEEMKEDEKNFDKRTFHHRKDEFKKQTISFELKGFGDFEQSDEDIFKENYQMLHMNELQAAVDSFTKQYNYKYNFYRTRLTKNEYLKSEIKFRTPEDSVKYKKIDSIKRNIPASDLPIIFDTDSAYNSLTIIEQKKTLKGAIAYAEKVQEEITKSRQELLHKKEWIAKHQIIWHTKITLSLACFIFFFIGAPLGAIIRKGGFGLPVIISLLFFILYYIINMTAKKFVTEGVWNATFGMWLSSALTFPIGIFLTYKATTDSVILNFDTYIDGIKRIGKKIRRKKFKHKKK